MKIFLIAEVFILVFALAIAVLRGLPGPVFFPIRALAVVYVDLFRGVPTILVIYILGFGIPALALPGVPIDPLFWGVVSLVLVYSAYVSEVYRAGIESVHPSQAAAARSLGLTHGQALRFVVIPQAVRRVIPPLLNDFIGLQKDTALVGLLGVVEAFRQSQIEVAASFNYTPYIATAIIFIALTIPMARFTDWLVSRDKRRQQAGRARVSGSALEMEGVCASPSGSSRCCAGSTSSWPSTRSSASSARRAPGKSTLLRCVNLLEPVDSGRIVVRGEEITARARRRERRAPRDRDRLPVLQPLPAHVRSSRTSRSGRERRSGLSRAEAESRADELLARFGLADKREEYPDRLSGGQQQRVAIVRALAMQPNLMLFDEVTSALDPELVAEVLQVIRELASEGMTMLIATHEMSFARDVAHRVCFLDAGVILEEGTAAEIFGAPREPRTQQFLQRIVEAGRL